MRAELAPWGVDLLLALAGLAILFTIGLVPLRPTTIVAALGLGYLTGTAVVSMLLIILLVLGIPVTLVTFAVVVLGCLLAAAPGLRRRVPRSRPSRDQAWWRSPWRTWSLDTWAVMVFVVCAGAFALVGLADAWKMPLGGWDAWSIWARKAQMLAGHDTLVPDFFASKSYLWVHLEYPLLVPLWEALHGRAAGQFVTQTVLRHMWLFVVCFPWAIAYLVREHVRPIVWTPILLLLIAAPGAWSQLLSGYADVPMAMFVCLAAICLAFWLSRGDRRMLVLSSIMLGAAANTKNEGLMAAVALIIVGWIVTLAARQRIKPMLLATAAVAVLGILPWRLWVAAHHIETEISLSKGLDPIFLWHHADRLGPSIEGIARELSDPGQWLYIVPLAALVVTACLISGIGRRVAGFYLAGFFVVCLGFLWSYVVSPNEIGWLLETSVNRTVTALVLVAVAALVHLTGLLFSSLSRGEPPPGSAP